MTKNQLAKKSQTEMIGLIIIVILVITGLLIFTVYKATKTPDDARKVYINKALATNLLISMTNTNVRECHNHSLSSLIKDCAKPRPVITCIDYNSCQIANRTVFDIINKTLLVWGVRFNLSVSSPFKDTILNFDNDCDSTATEKEPGFILIPLGNDVSAEMTLDICTD